MTHEAWVPVDELPGYLMSCAGAQRKFSTSISSDCPSGHSE